MAGASPVENEAFVTLATNDTYSLGALVLAHSLRRVGTTRRLAIMVTPGVSSSLRSQLASVFDFVVPVDVLDSQDQVNLSLLTRPDLGVTFTKLHCWRLTQFAKCVFLDADTLVVQNIDELFDREELSAAPDAGWPDCFNSGVFVYTPSTETYQALLNFAVQYGSFDGGDQGLLNLYFSDWSTKDIKRHLPFTYNVVSQAFYSYLPAFRQFGKSVKIVHFIGALKPWHASYNTATRQASGDSGTFHHQEYLQLWWDIFMAEVNVKLDPEVTGIREARILSFVTSSPYHAFQRISANQDQAMIAPYKPPDLNIFYEPFREEEKADCEKEEIHTYIAPPNPDRTFEHFENFYAEPPMSRSENYPQSAEVYTSCDQQVTLEDFTKSSSPETEEIVTDNNCTSEDSNNATDSSNNHEHSPLDNNVTNQRPADNPDDNHNPGDQSEESVGLVGELASLRIVDPAGPQGAYSQEQLQNRQRQYEWERGQVDYLGMDSFSQIQQHLDNVVSGRTAIDLKVGVATTGAAASDTEKPAASDAEKPAEKQ